MNGPYRTLLQESLRSMDIPYEAVQLDQLQAYIAEIELFNPVYKLVAAQKEELVIRHILDSLAAYPTIKALCDMVKPCEIADLGSGAGLPGIPLAIMLSECPFSLVERMGRRVDFLGNALVRTNLTDRVNIIDCDLRQVRQQFSIVTFRAFHPLVDILDLVAPILRDDGYVCAYKAGVAQVEMELQEVQNVCKSSWKSEFVTLKVPHLDAKRSLCLLQKN